MGVLLAPHRVRALNLQWGMTLGQGPLAFVNQKRFDARGAKVQAEIGHAVLVTSEMRGSHRQAAGGLGH